MTTECFHPRKGLCQTLLGQTNDGFVLVSLPLLSPSATSLTLPLAIMSTTKTTTTKPAATKKAAAHPPFAEMITVSPPAPFPPLPPSIPSIPDDPSLVTRID